MGESRVARAREIAALRTGLDCGLTLIDTAEMYAGGRAEEVVGEAIAGRRDEVFLASKVLPEHSSGRGTMSACERSLKRLRTDRLDLYLLHWRGSIGLDETMEALALLQRQGKNPPLWRQQSGPIRYGRALANEVRVRRCYQSGLIQPHAAWH
jgi:aldehyde reductase